MINLKSILNEGVDINTEKETNKLNSLIQNLVDKKSKELLSKLKGKEVEFLSSSKVTGKLKDIKFTKDNRNVSKPYTLNVVMDDGHPYEVLSDIKIKE